MSGGKLEIVPGATSRRFEKVWQFAWICCFAIVAWFSFLMLPTSPIAPDLDLSWTGALTYFAHRGFHFGTDVIFTLGPLGHFAGYAYTGYLTTERTLWEFVAKGLVAVLCCWALRELRLFIQVTLAVCIILFLGSYEDVYTFAIVLTGLLLLRSAERKFWIHALLALFLAVLSLVKFTYFIEGTCAIGSVVGYYIIRRRWIALTSLTSSFSVGLLFCWGLAGQNIADLPLYVSNSIAITVGYNAAMFRPTSNLAIIALAALLGVLLVFQLALFWFYARDRARVIFGSIFLVLILFFIWKHAFTRWENHAPKFFLLFPELLLASWLLNSKTSRSDRCAVVITCVALISAVVGMTLLQQEIVSQSLNRSRDQFRFAWRLVTRYGRFEKGRKASLAQTERKFSLPRIKTVVGDRSVDVISYRQGIAILNGLNYVPRPVFQGYSAYTPSLIELNTKHYQSLRRPQFVIAKLETIDDRFPTLDDSGVLLELLYHYQPILNENGWHLWEAKRDIGAINRRLIESFSGKLGQVVPIPDNASIWVELELKQTRWGRIAAFLYKSVPILITLEDDAGLRSRYRIIPSMTGNGWLLNPVLTNDDQLVLAAKGAPLQRYKWFKVDVEPGSDAFFKATFGIKFSALPPAVSVPADPALSNIPVN